MTMEVEPVIFVGEGGTFESGPLRTSLADFDRVLNFLRASGKRRLILHFHGGCVSRQSAARHARELAAVFQATPASFVALAWGTGVGEIIQSKLADLHKVKAFRKLLAWALEKVLALAGGQDTTRGMAPASLDHGKIETILEQEDGAIQLETVLPDSAARDAKGGEIGEDETLRLKLAVELSSDPELFAAIDENPTLTTALESQQGSRGVTPLTIAALLGKVVVATLNRLRKGTDHGLYATTIEELLRVTLLANAIEWLWKEMKSGAKSMWKPNNSALEPCHVGSCLLERLEEWQAADPELRVDVVGHSAGAIAICEMLAAIRSHPRNVTLDNVVLLAPACRLEVFAEAVARNPNSANRFRLFALDDAHERGDRLVPAIYPHSLLYLVSGALEDRADAPLAGLERHLRFKSSSADESFDDCRRWLAQDHRLIFAPTLPGAAARETCAAVGHVGFDVDPGIIAGLKAMAEGSP